MRVAWEWNGIEHWTGGDLMETLALISEQEEADSFMEAYGELFEDGDDAIECIRYFIQIVGYDPDDENGELHDECVSVCELLGIDMPDKDEVISPRQTFGSWSLGHKVAA